MKNFLGIRDVKALQILDSRGNPTIQVEVITEDGYVGKHMSHLEHLLEALKRLNYVMVIKVDI